MRTIRNPASLACQDRSHWPARIRPSSALAGRCDLKQPEDFCIDLAKFFTEVVVVEAGIGGADQMQDAIPHALRQAAMTGPSAAGVCQIRLTALPIARLESFDMPRC